MSNFFFLFGYKGLTECGWFWGCLVASETSTVSEEKVRFAHPHLPDTLIKIQCLYKLQRVSPVPAAVSESLMKYIHGTNPPGAESLTTF